jgi:hypothetical protein
MYCTNPNFKFKTDPKIMADIMQAFKEEKTTEDRAKQKAVAAAATEVVTSLEAPEDAGMDDLLGPSVAVQTQALEKANEQHEAALLLQAVQRGNAARRELQQMKRVQAQRAGAGGLLGELETTEEQHDAASKLQAVQSEDAARQNPFESSSESLKKANPFRSSTDLAVQDEEDDDSDLDPDDPYVVTPRYCMCCCGTSSGCWIVDLSCYFRNAGTLLLHCFRTADCPAVALLLHRCRIGAPHSRCCYTSVSLLIVPQEQSRF